jgi:3-hydroxyacyl-[acyl-carrier-protein] dehydratase
MRWMWIDRFVEFQSGRRAVARKNISIVEEQIDEYSPAFPYMPASLIIEGIAQTAGLLVGERSGFKDRVILAKVTKAVLHRLARPGDTLIYTAEVADIKRDGAFCNCTSHYDADGELQAEVELVFAMLDDRFPDPIFDPADFLAMIRTFGLYEVGVDANGQPLQVPQHLLDAERARP